MNNLPTQNQKGAAMVEYALLVALILTVCITSVTVIGQDTRDLYTDVSAAFGDTNPNLGPN